MKLPSFLFKKLKKHNTSLGDNPIFPPESSVPFDYKLVKERYNEIIHKAEINSINFEKIDELKTELSKLIIECVKIEAPIKNELTKLCEDIVYSVFGVPNDIVDVECELVRTLKPKKAFRITPDDINIEFNDLNDINNANSAVLKRRVINSLIQGAAYDLSSEKYYLDKISNIAPNLIPLYKRIRIINDVLLFSCDEKITDKSPNQGSCVDVELGEMNMKTYIHSQGVIFPFLLCETFRGFLELFASHGLPHDNDKAKYILNQADFLMAEPWDLRIGVGLWRNITKNVDDTKIIPFYFTNICKLNIDTFNSTIKEVLAKTKHGTALQNSLLDKSKKEYRLINIDGNISNKGDKSVIEDQYMTEEDISKTDVPDYTELFKQCLSEDIDFIDKEINDKQLQLTITIKGETIPTNIIDFKIEPRKVGDESLYQFHLFIKQAYKHLGMGYKICKQFVKLYGNIYCGKGRMLNTQEIPAIFNKLKNEENIQVYKISNSNGVIGICAKLDIV